MSKEEFIIQLQKLAEYNEANVDNQITFEYGGTMIADPFMDPTGRFEVNPLVTYPILPMVDAVQIYLLTK